MKFGKIAVITFISGLEIYKHVKINDKIELCFGVVMTPFSAVLTYKGGQWVILDFIPCHRKYSQSECRKTVVYSTVLHPIFQ